MFWNTQAFWLIIAYVIWAYVAARFLPRLVGPIIVSRAKLSGNNRISERRMTTMRKLAEGLLRGFIFVVAAILILSIFVNTTGLFTFLGLFSAAFGLGARPLVSDYLSGVIFLVEDHYNIGEKVEIFNVEGTVEDVNLRTTHLRAPSGELHIIPNGEIRNVRNFSRGTFSLGTVQVDVKTNQLEHASAVLNEKVPLAVEKIPDLISAPQIISESGLIGTHTRFTIVAKANYGRGALVRRQLLEYIHEVLSSEGIETAG